MKLPKYDGNIHPNEWIKQIQICCFLKKIVKDDDILQIAKTMIDPIIINNNMILENNITSLEELNNLLKQQNSFLIFKNSSKRKLQLLKFQIKNDDMTKYILEFRSLCRDAEINDFEEQKKYFIQSILPINLIDSFIKESNSMNELIKNFDDFLLNYSRIIKNNSCVALKHIATGKYLSSCNKKYQNSNYNLVYCGDNILNNDALWIISNNNITNLITFQNSITLKHKSSSNNYLSVDSDYKACGGNEGLTIDWTLQHSKNERNYLESKDNVLLKISFGKNTSVKNLTLRSHENILKIDNNDYQEVFAHENRIGGIDEVLYVYC
ncbi:hypothetical protein RhiirA4_489154 [Rhizophagus irregularis]|uniref:MIR domain-containing protein n=1 Tax=Rhizophagus irregularis TaxID=588596 RepID=A0A2I1HUI1_9GLOM|nr:hypothetical protein RhiirA4_489154 [Rhizophagus irregularis]